MRVATIPMSERGSRRPHADVHVEAGVAQVQRPRPALVAVADDTHGLAAQRAEIGVLLVVDRRHDSTSPVARRAATSAPTIPRVAANTRLPNTPPRLKTAS